MSEIDKPPPAMDEGRLLMYALVDESVTYVNKSMLYVNGELLGRVPRLAIYESLDADEWSLFFCDEDWCPLGVSVLASLEEARERAESEYHGITDKWIDAGVPAADAARYLSEQDREESCSFCGRPPVEVRQMFSSSTARICEQCVREFFAECSTEHQLPE
jgi:hypothetical protein